MDANTPQGPTPQDSHDAEVRVMALTGMSADAAYSFMQFHSGMRWLRRDA